MARPEDTGRRESTGLPGRFWWLGASALFVIVGSLGTWTKTQVLGMTLESWTGVERDGWVALIAGGAALASALFFAGAPGRPRPLWPLAVCAAAAVLGAGVALYDWVEIPSSADRALGDPIGDQSGGWGLDMTWVASVNLFLASAVCLGRDTAVQGLPAAFSARHRVLADALRWTGLVLLGVDVVILFALGQGLIATGPETETLGQGFVGSVLITGGILLVLMALLAYWFPRLAGTILLVGGIHLFVAVAAGERSSECDPNCWVSGERRGELSGLAAVVANSDALSSMLFVLPPIAGLVVFVAGFLRHRAGANSPRGQAPARPPVLPA